MVERTVRSKVIEKGIKDYTQYLLVSQREDGGWGLQKQSLLSSPTNSGEALVALFRTERRDEVEASIESGIRYLIHSQCPDGGWSRANICHPDECRGQTIATCWALHSLGSAIDFFKDTSHQVVWIDSIRRAHNFLLDSSNRSIKGSWRAFPQGKSSVSATCSAIISLLASKGYNSFRKDDIDRAAIQGLAWLITEAQNGDGGIGFFRNDVSRLAPSLQLLFTACYADLKGIRPPEFLRLVDWIKSEFRAISDSQPFEPETEFADYKTVHEDFQHFVAARALFVLSKEYVLSSLIGASNELSNVSANKNLIDYVRAYALQQVSQLGRSSGGCQISRNSPMYTWATSQALLAFSAYQQWKKNSSPPGDSQSCETWAPVVVDKGLKYILHISDLHFDLESTAERWYNQLAEDLRNNFNCRKLDLVIVSGDIGNKSKPEEYVEAKRFFDLLIAEFRVEQDGLVVVPGNHDLNWEISEAAFQLVRKKNFRGTLITYD